MDPLRPTRRGAIGGGLAGLAAATVPASAARARARRVHDVVVVGAGLSGLTAADRVRRAGRSVVVLEARRRVGGRNLDVPIPGGVVELGGEWTGPGQDVVLGLAKDLGIATFPTFADGASVYYAGGARQTYTGDIPPANPASLVELEALILDLNSKGRSVDAAKPWQAPSAPDLDRQSVGAYIHASCQTAEARALAAVAIAGVYGEDPELISLLDLVSQIPGVGGDFNTLIGDAQSTRFVGGPQQLSVGLARRLSRAVRLGEPVVGVEQRDGVVAVVTRREVVRARQVILTPPKPVLGALRYRPLLPPAYDQLFQRQPMGSVTKINVIYDEPFWRADGLSGTAVCSDDEPVRIVYDNSPPAGRPGVLVCFLEGNASRRAFGLAQAQRRELAVRSLEKFFGPRARTGVTGYYDQVWATEAYTRGAYGTYSPPGVLTALGAATDGPAGSVHFAGDGFSALWPGYMDGAIRSGVAAAGAVLAEL